MISSSPFIIVNPERDVPQELCDDIVLPVESYAEIWEQDARWLLGPGFLSAIVAWVRDHDFSARVSTFNPSMIDLAVPMPHMVSFGGHLLPASEFVPEELRAIFNYRWYFATSCYAKLLLSRLAPIIGRQVTSVTLAEMNFLIQNEARQRKAHGLPQFHEIVAAYFGFRPGFGLPQPAGVQFVEAS